jgi:hypothetical protein
MRKAPSMSAPHVDGLRWEHVRDLHIPAWRRWISHYSAGKVHEDVADFLASATYWALPKQTIVDHETSRMRGD